MGFGLFGKLPQKRDFVSVNLPLAVLNPFETWLQSAVAASRSEIGRGWEDYYLVAPIWRFWLGREIFGTVCAGALMPSVDQVGRYFPLAIIYVTDEGENFPPPLQNLLDDWYRALEGRLLSVLSEDDRADVGYLLAGLPTPAQVLAAAPAVAAPPRPVAAPPPAPPAPPLPPAPAPAPPVATPPAAPMAVLGVPSSSRASAQSEEAQAALAAAMAAPPPWEISDDDKVEPPASASPAAAPTAPASAAPPEAVAAPAAPAAAISWDLPEAATMPAAAPPPAAPRAAVASSTWDVPDDPVPPAAPASPATPVATPPAVASVAAPPGVAAPVEVPPPAAAVAAPPAPPAVEAPPPAVVIEKPAAAAVPPQAARVHASEFKGSMLAAVETDGSLAQALGELRDLDYRYAAFGRGYWWCAASATGSALVHAGKGLPDPYFFSRMLMWSKRS